MSQPIIDFLQPRKEAWLKKKIKANMDEHEIRLLDQECQRLFSLEEWLPKAAKRAGQMSISTHPCTFTHPSARKNKNDDTSAVIANSYQANDGYLRSGNVVVQTDALGNGAVLDVHSFLTLVMTDGQLLLEHIKKDTKLAKGLLTIKNAEYAELKKGFLAMTSQSEESITSSKVKQVYFPVGNGYHQLSLLTASGISYELRRRIDELRFSDERKQAKECEKNNEYSDTGYKSILDLTTIGYGGANPQNISVLNSKNVGKTHLLSSVPPKLIKRDVQFPLTDFFSQSVHPSNFKDIFYALHILFLKYGNNWELRLERDDYYREIIDRIIRKMWQLRFVADEQYNEGRSQLSNTQKIWLLSENQDIRDSENVWLDDLTRTIASFIFHGYEKVLRKKAIMFSDAELEHIHQIVINTQESLR